MAWGWRDNCQDITSFSPHAYQRDPSRNIDRKTEKPQGELGAKKETDKRQRGDREGQKGRDGGAETGEH